MKKAKSSKQVQSIRMVVVVFDLMGVKVRICRIGFKKT